MYYEYKMVSRLETCQQQPTIVILYIPLYLCFALRVLLLTCFQMPVQMPICQILFSASWTHCFFNNLTLAPIFNMPIQRICPIKLAITVTTLNRLNSTTKRLRVELCMNTFVHSENSQTSISCLWLLSSVTTHVYCH